MSSNWILASALMAFALAGAAWLDGPSDYETAQVVEDDMQEAQATAEREAILRERCRILRGQRAELAMIRGTDDYACRLEEAI